MKKEGKYKFNLQFPSETEEQIRVGELLERLGRQKSVVVVEAVNAYLSSHPELLKGECRIEVHSNAAYDKKMLEQLMREVVAEHFASAKSPQPATHPIVSEENLDEDISTMLDNLDFFQ